MGSMSISFRDQPKGLTLADRAVQLAKLRGVKINIQCAKITKIPQMAISGQKWSINVFWQSNLLRRLTIYWNWWSRKRHQNTSHIGLHIPFFLLPNHKSPRRSFVECLCMQYLIIAIIIEANVSSSLRLFICDERLINLQISSCPFMQFGIGLS
jgi:hypothetical protein